MPTDYIDAGEPARERRRVREELCSAREITTGRLDTRFSGPTLDPMSKEAEYDPQSAAISSAYVSAFNDYVRNTLKFGERMTYKAEIDVEKIWDFLHQPPGAPQKLPGALNVMPDLAVAMKQNPKLKVHAERRLLRSRDAVLRRACSRCSSCPSRAPCRTTSRCISTPRATWSMRMSPT